MPRFRKIASYKTIPDLVEKSASLGIRLPFTNPSHQSLLGSHWNFNDSSRNKFTVGNRFTILPMEGWDGSSDGAPTERVRRRWLRFAESGAKLLWFEATAVRHDGRANPRQLVLDEKQAIAFRDLHREVKQRHQDCFGNTDDLVTGIQLTHSGRWSRPEGIAAPRIVYRHPFLDERAGVNGDHSLLSDADIDLLVKDYVAAAVRASDAGFDFVDLKHCHGYFAHELLSAYERPGRYGGTLEGRTRFLRQVVEAIRAQCPDLAIAVRFSAYDLQPYRAGIDQIGEPVSSESYPYAFGSDSSGLHIDLDEIFQFVSCLHALGIGLICVTAGSPYYTPHIQRPAFYPPCDGYLPPEDPLLSCARLLQLTFSIKKQFPDLAIVGTGFTYLQQHLAAIASGCISEQWMDSIGLGRMSLSYPHLPDDLLNGRPMAKKSICRTFSDCTTAPRNGLVSGCFPLDGFYRDSADYTVLQSIKRTANKRTAKNEPADAG